MTRDSSATEGDHCRPGIEMLSPFWICPQPMSRQCFSTRRLSAIFSPSFVHTGDVSCSFARSPLTCDRRSRTD